MGLCGCFGARDDVRDGNKAVAGAGGAGGTSHNGTPGDTREVGVKSRDAQFASGDGQDLSRRGVADGLGDPASRRSRRRSNGGPGDHGRRLSSSKNSESVLDAVEEGSSQSFGKIMHWLKDAEKYQLEPLGVKVEDIVNIEDVRIDDSNMAEYAPPSEADRFPRKMHAGASGAA